MGLGCGRLVRKARSRRTARVCGLGLMSCAPPLPSLFACSNSELHPAAHFTPLVPVGQEHVAVQVLSTAEHAALRRVSRVSTAGRAAGTLNK